MSCNLCRALLQRAVTLSSVAILHRCHCLICSLLVNDGWFSCVLLPTSFIPNTSHNIYKGRICQFVFCIWFLWWNGRDASVEYKHCYSGRRVHTGTHFIMYIKFWGRLAPSQAWMQNMGNHCLKVKFLMQCSKTQLQCTQNMHKDWYCTNTSVKDFVWWYFLSSLTATGIKPYTGRLCKVCTVRGFRLALWYL